MGKRFTDISKWTNNKWYFNLSIESKLFWIYLLDSCDSVGVWEENIKLANITIGYTYSLDTLLKDFKKQIYIFKDNRKWWIKDFCDFQYGILREDSSSKPIQSYISLLKKHSLWIVYGKGIDSLKEKEQEKEKDKIKEKEEEFKKQFEPFLKKYPKETLNEFFRYWSESNKSRTALRWEMEKTWDIGRRLSRWASNDSKFKKKPESKIDGRPMTQKEMLELQKTQKNQQFLGYENDEIEKMENNKNK